MLPLRVAALVLSAAGPALAGPPPPPPALPSSLFEQADDIPTIVGGTIEAPPEPEAPKPGPPGPPAPPDMVSFPAGPFIMGCEGELPACGDDSKPPRTITLAAFAIERRLVSQRDYAACLKASGCTEPVERFLFEPEKKADHPAVGVNWHQADAYCSWKGRRLPSEAEWTRAARGTDGRLYPWGSSPFQINDGATPEGVEGLLGTVKHWTADWYSPEGFGRLAERDPTGEPAGTLKAVRGLEALFAGQGHATFRASRHPDRAESGVGFRCALTLGDRKPTPSAQPKAAEGPPLKVVDVAVGEVHTCAVDVEGAVWCWGNDRFRQLGPRTERKAQPSLVPRRVDVPPSDAIEAGSLSTCARGRTGWLQCWGQHAAVGGVGRFGVGGTVCGVLRPVSGPPPAAPLTFDGPDTPRPAFGPPGAIACSAQAGPFGNGGPMQPLFDPAAFEAGKVPEVLGPRDPVDIAVGHDHVCAVAADGQPWCWGKNATGQLGVDGDDPRPLPVKAGTARPADIEFPPLVERLGPVVELAAGSHHTCARHRSGQVSCWGRGTYGVLGVPWPNRSDRRLGPLEMPMAVPVKGVDDAVALVDGQDTACAIRADRSLWCWGDNAGGQLGDGTIVSRAVAAPVQGLPGPVVAADGGRQNLCAIVEGGDLWCWGSNEHGQVGDGTRVDRTRPVPVRRPAP